MMSEYVRREDFDNHDHRFAEFLRENGWNGDTVTVRDSVKFLTPDKEPIAIAFYNNMDLTYDVYIEKGLNNGSS